MSQSSEREPTKCQRSLRKDDEGSDLSLSGSQMSLASRPRSVMGKASMRALAVSGPRLRRPMSAIPTITYPEGIRDKRRPYSADSQPPPLYSGSHRRRNKLAARFPSPSDRDYFEIDGDVELSSSTLLSSHLSEPVGGTWTELEMHGLYPRHRGVIPAVSSDSSTDLLCSSDISEEPTRSEKSLGERIRAMAQETCNHNSNLTVQCDVGIMPLTPSSKQEIPCDDRTQAGKNYEEEKDPKNMTTRELHFRMVEAGLILHPKKNPSQCILEQEDSLDQIYREFFRDCQNLSEDVQLKPKLSHGSQDEKCNDSDNFDFKDHQMKEENASKFLHASGTSSRCNFTVPWVAENSFCSGTSKNEYSIDEVCFPEDHDIESVDGDLGSRNSTEVNQCDKIDAFPNAMGDVQEPNWMKQSLAPVRFQQWVRAERDENAENVDLFTPYFCGTQQSPPRPKKPNQFIDCMVEEVIGDIDELQNKCSIQNRKHEPPNNVPEQHPLNRKDKQDGKEDESIHYSELENSKKEITTNERIIISNTSSVEQNSEQLENCRMPSSKPMSAEADSDQSLTEKLPVKRNKVSLSQSEPSLEDASGKYHPKVGPPDQYDVVGTLSARQSRTSPGRSGVKRDSIGNNQPIQPSFTNVRSSENSSTQGSSLNNKGTGRCGTRRKTDIRPPCHSHRGKRSIGINSDLQNIPKPREEVLPGESQQEVVSWMSICAEQLSDRDNTPSCSSLTNNHSVKVHPQLQAVPPMNPDSPYNEIMTILRVLEGEEDESSLLSVLQKRGNTDYAASETSTPALPSTISQSSTTPIPTAVVSTPRVTSSPDQGTVSEDMKNLQSTHPEMAGSPANFTKTSSDFSVANQGPAQGELRDLLTFLDAVDQSCTSVLDSSHSHPCSLRNISPVPTSSQTQLVAAGSNGMEDLLLLGHTDLAQEVLTLRLAVEERDANISLLRTAVREMREGQERRDKAHAKDLDDCRRQIKTECEAVVKRHQKFIDQLIADKASLSERCEKLVQEAREADERHTRSITTMEQKHKLELQRVKDITSATEKLKRERWVENKTQKIKELTVRGLEPELTRLTGHHEQEMSALRTLHAQEIEQIELRAARRCSQQMETLREQLIQEKEEALAREREALRLKMEKEQAMYEEETAEQRRRLVSEVRRERDRFTTHEARLEAQFEERRRNLEREAEKDRDRVRRDYADKVDALHRKQQVEISQLREGLKAEKEAWIATYQQQQQQAIAQATTEIREQLKRERDREIEVVIERLENEATLSREEKEKAAENRLRRVREQLGMELRDVESALNTLKEKHVEVRQRLQEKEDVLASLEAQNRSLHTQLLETQKIADQLSAERADLKETLRGELSGEIEALRQQQSDQYLRHKQEMAMQLEQTERDRITHQQELQQLYARVKLAIAKKEEVVKVARAKQKAAEEQSAHLQALLEHRRREALLS